MSDLAPSPSPERRGEQDTVACITIWQPWASLIVGGIEAERIVIADAMELGLSLEGAIVKDTENRAWPTSHRGTLVIHSARRNYRPGVQQVAPGLRIDVPPGLPRGMCLGTVQLVACDRGGTSIWAEPGHFHWHLEEPVAFDQPVPWRGRERLFEVPWPYEALRDAWRESLGLRGQMELPVYDGRDEGRVDGGRRGTANNANDANGTTDGGSGSSAANGAAAKEGENGQGNPAVAGPRSDERGGGVAAVGQDARPTQEADGSRLPTYAE